MKINTSRNITDNAMCLPNNERSKKSIIRIVLVDDHPMMRQAIRIWLESNEDMKVIAEAFNGKEALEIVDKLRPDVVIMDISMPKLNGLEATREIIALCPETKVLALTVHTDREHIRGMMQAGASGYLTKTIAGEEVVHAVREITTGESFLPSSPIESEDDEFEVASIPKAQGDSYGDLTYRELKILKFIAKGLSNKQIATIMGIGIRSIKTVLTMIYIKLGASSRTEAISIGLTSGIISIDDLKH